MPPLLQPKVHNVYMMQNLVGDPPLLECPINLSLLVFASVCNARSLDIVHRGYLSPPFQIITPFFDSPLLKKPLNPGFIQGWGIQVSPRFCLFVSDVNQGDKAAV